ncbi:Hypothetical protein R9X50_00406700 [Acrodontium crateriforme]|uniref:Uncharacterized protein n=1 Tax=Acrodontium crateriforme TaxID=150365 RepID=A0AAQ3R9X5_9PEZI|nr:Hypothetical protein R9X50_00406700 [Acrodontium crateriforme]
MAFHTFRAFPSDDVLPSHPELHLLPRSAGRGALSESEKIRLYRLLDSERWKHSRTRVMHQNEIQRCQELENKVKQGEISIVWLRQRHKQLSDGWTACNNDLIQCKREILLLLKEVEDWRSTAQFALEKQMPRLQLDMSTAKSRKAEVARRRTSRFTSQQIEIVKPLDWKKFDSMNSTGAVQYTNDNFSKDENPAIIQVEEHKNECLESETRQLPLENLIHELRQEDDFPSP